MISEESISTKNYNYNTYYSQQLQTTKERIIYIYIQDSFLCQLKRKSNEMEKNNNKVENDTHCTQYGQVQS